MVAEEMLVIFDKNPVATREVIKRLSAEISIKYGASDKLTGDLIKAFVETGRLKIEG